MRWPAKGGAEWSDRLQRSLATIIDWIHRRDQKKARVLRSARCSCGSGPSRFSGGRAGGGGASPPKGRLVRMADRRNPEGKRGLCRLVAQTDRCDRPTVSVQILRPPGGAAGVLCHPAVPTMPRRSCQYGLGTGQRLDVLHISRRLVGRPPQTARRHRSKSRQFLCGGPPSSFSFRVDPVVAQPPPTMTLSQPSLSRVRWLGRYA